jgi:hypothetical protein
LEFGTINWTIHLLSSPFLIVLGSLSGLTTNRSESLLIAEAEETRPVGNYHLCCCIGQKLAQFSNTCRHY